VVPPVVLNAADAHSVKPSSGVAKTPAAAPKIKAPRPRGAALRINTTKTTTIGSVKKERALI